MIDFTSSKRAIAIAAGLVVLVTSAGIADAATTASTNRDTELRFGTTSNRTGQSRLAQATIKGSVYVTLESKAKSRIKSVTFRLDDTKREKAPLLTELEYPYDFAGGNWDATGSAKPFDTTKLAEGRHSILADVTMNNGRTKRVLLASLLPITAPLR